MKTNIGEAILILGSIYFILNFRMRWWGTLGVLALIGLAVFSWEFTHYSKEKGELTKLQLQKIKLELALMDAQTQFYIARGAAILRGLKPR